MEETKAHNFLEEIILEDLNSGKHKEIITRFPPEPNGYLHIGHATSICLNFGLAEKFGGKTNLRFDDTNPSKESQEFVDSIKADVQWLGFTWNKELYASDYFNQLYEWAVFLIKQGKAYVDDSTSEEIAAMKGTPTEPGINSPYRNRTIEENLHLFEEMKNGVHPEGSKVLRAKIDMASSNMHLRDPLMYRIKFAHHHRTGNTWCIFPIYDWAHGQSDSIEKITHSICTMEFEVHRPLYEWFIEQLSIFPSKQYEFARRNITYTVMSKRKLLQLVEEKIVDGWDDPRMPTISGLRRRGYTPESIRNFCDRIGVGRRENAVDMAQLEFSVRDHLNKIAQRAMVVIHPIKVTILNYPENKTENLEAINNPENPEAGTRKVSFSKNLYIEQSDFMENPPKGYFRLYPGGIVKLRYAYYIKCEEVIKNSIGDIMELRCTYIEDPSFNHTPEAKKVKGIIHWVDANNSTDVEVRLYDRLFTVEDPSAEENEHTSFLSFINPNSLVIHSSAKAEAFLKNANVQDRFQFERLGYFCVDKYSTTNRLVFNRTVTLKDTWAKMVQKNG